MVRPECYAPAMNLRLGHFSLTLTSLSLVALTSFCCFVTVRHILAISSRPAQLQSLRRRNHRRPRHFEMDRRQRRAQRAQPAEAVLYPALPDNTPTDQAPSPPPVEPASLSESSRPTSAALYQGTNLLLPSGAVLSTDMVAMLLYRRDRNHCTARCLPCHFHEIFHRELAEEDCQAVLEGDMESTDQDPQNGITEVMGAAVPTGIFYEVISCLRNNHTILQIKELISIRFATILDPDLIASIGEVHEDRALSHFNRGRRHELSTERPRHVGHRLNSLSLTPVTAREGTPRTSFMTTPPPLYRSNAILRDLLVGGPLPPFGPNEIGVPVYTAVGNASPAGNADVHRSSNLGSPGVDATITPETDLVSPLLLDAEATLPLRPPPLPLRSSRRPAANALALTSPPRTRRILSTLRHQQRSQSNLTAPSMVPTPLAQDQRASLSSDSDRGANLPIRIGSPAPISFHEIQFNNPTDAEIRAPFARASITMRHRSDGWRWAAQSSPPVTRERRHASEVANPTLTLTHQRRHASEVMNVLLPDRLSTSQASQISAAQPRSPAPPYETIQFGNPFQRRARTSSGSEYQDSPPRSLYAQRQSTQSSNRISPRDLGEIGAVESAQRGGAPEIPVSPLHRDAAIALLELRERVTVLEEESSRSDDLPARPLSFVRRRNQPQNPWGLLSTLVARDTTNRQGYNGTVRQGSRPDHQAPIFSFNGQPSTTPGLTIVQNLVEINMRETAINRLQETRHIHEFGDVDFQTWQERYILWWARFPVTTFEEFGRTRWAQQRRRRELSIDGTGQGALFQGPFDVQEETLGVAEDLDHFLSEGVDTVEARQRRNRDELFNDWQAHVRAARERFPDRVWEHDRTVEQFLRVWDGAVQLGSAEDDTSRPDTPASAHIGPDQRTALSSNPPEDGHLNPALQQELEIPDNDVISDCLFIAAKHIVEKIHVLEFGGGVGYDRWRTRFKVWWGWEPLLSRHAFRDQADEAPDSSAETWSQQRGVYRRWCEVFEATRSRGANRTQTEFTAIWYGPRELNQEQQRHQLDWFHGLVIPHTPQARRLLFSPFQTALRRQGIPLISEETFLMVVEEKLRENPAMFGGPLIFESWLIYQPGNGDEDEDGDENDGGSDLPYTGPIDIQVPQMPQATVDPSTTSPTQNRADSPTIPILIHRDSILLHRDLPPRAPRAVNNTATANRDTTPFTPISDSTTAFLAFREYFRWSHTAERHPRPASVYSFPFMTQAEFNTIYHARRQSRRSFFQLAAEAEIARDREHPFSPETVMEMEELYATAYSEARERMGEVEEREGSERTRRLTREARRWWEMWRQFWYETYRTIPTIGLEDFRVVFEDRRDIYEVVTRWEIERLSGGNGGEGGIETVVDREID